MRKCCIERCCAPYWKTRLYFVTICRDASKLSNDWNRAVPHPSTLHIGSRWVREQASAVLEVPSAIVPIESNFLLNPAHPEFGEIEVGSPIDLPIDSRVFNKLK